MPVSEPGNIRPRINKIVNTRYGSVAVPQTTIPKNKYNKYYKNLNYINKLFNFQNPIKNSA